MSQRIVSIPLLLLAFWLVRSDAVHAASGPIPADALEKITGAVPATALAAPTKSRHLLIYDANVGYGGHPSAVYASEAFRIMGERTGAFAVEVHHDPEIFRPESLRRFDAVFLNNNVGNLFTDPELRGSLLGFILSGGGLMGVHGTAVAFTQWPGALEDWPEFALLLGGRGANHRDSNERVVVRLDDPWHPLNAAFGGESFVFQDEFFRVHEAYSRDRVRVLLSFDTERTNMNQGSPRGNCTRPDNDYAIAWLRNYGRGRTFYCTIAHNPYVFWDPQMLKFYLNAAQFVLGDLDAPTLPSARVNDLTRAQERLGWRVAVELPGHLDTPADPQQFRQETAWIGLRGRLPVRAGARPQIIAELTDLRLNLDAAGAALLTFRPDKLPANSDQWRSALEYIDAAGATLLIAPAVPADMKTLDRMILERGIRVSVPLPTHAGMSGIEHVLEEGAACSPAIGFGLNLAQATKGQIDPEQLMAALGQRLAVVEVSETTLQLNRWLELIKRADSKPVFLCGGGSTLQTERRDPAVSLASELSQAILKLDGPPSRPKP
jgi:type 1 glutamine amidotransferase